MPSLAPPNTNIRQVPGNNKGADYIIGDIHGELTLLRNFIDRIMKPDDRLFLVGDLTDRGENSLGVLMLLQERIAQRQRNNLPPQLLIVRGNHEDVLAKYINTQLMPDKFDQVTHERAKKKLIKLGGTWVENIDKDVLIRQLSFIESLPYIIHVKGERPFNVVHADMPFDDDELLERLSDEEKCYLTANEIEYATWARMEDENIPLEDTGRDIYSMPTYCGHNILGGVREDTNHINLDFGSFESQHLCVANHTHGRCEIFDGETFLEDAKLYQNFSAKKILEDPEHSVEVFLGVKRQINSAMDFRPQPVQLLQELLDKYSQRTKLFTHHNQKLNQTRVSLLKDAIDKIKKALLPEDIENALTEVLVKNIIAVCHARSFNNKYRFGDLHRTILDDYPQLAFKIVEHEALKEFNRTPAGEKRPITLGDIASQLNAEFLLPWIKPR